ncbi:MAG TPA: TIGR04076 family protein [Candidatus Saccharimonadales bacterium]|nr:TIGR04076 family protein [Candidatus Saccharimonadales bacterium]
MEDFSLYDLEVSVVGDPKKFVCSHTPGVAFRVVGENLIFGASTAFSLYALAALLPFMPAKQRETSLNDWMTTDTLFACPDPHCGAKFKITRCGQTSFKHSEVTRVPLPKGNQKGGRSS